MSLSSFRFGGLESLTEMGIIISAHRFRSFDEIDQRSVYTDSGDELTALTLRQRGELLLGDDRATLHSVTPIQPAVGFDNGHRDVLVIAYTAAPESL